MGAPAVVWGGNARGGDGRGWCRMAQHLGKVQAAQTNGGGHDGDNGRKRLPPVQRTRLPRCICHNRPFETHSVFGHSPLHACMRPVRVNEPLITVVISSVNQRLIRRVAPGLAAARSILSTAPVLYGMCAYNVCLCTHMSICASICLESSKILENRDVTLLC